MNKKILLVSHLFLLASLAQAQQTPDSEWRQANQQVAEFPRGHADVLKWEQANPVSTNTTDNKPATLSLKSIDDAVYLAWQTHPDLAKPLSQLGRAEVGQIASGQWQALSLSKLRKIDDADEVIGIAHATRKTVLAAIAVEQGLPSQQEAMQADEAAAELGSRLAKVGNWSKLQDAQQQLSRLTSLQQWQRSQYTALQSRASVLKSLQQWNRSTPQTLALPASLPSLPTNMLSEQAVQTRLNNVADTLPLGEQIGMRANAELAYSAYRTAYTLAKDSQQQVLKLRQFIYDETVLRYNGMLMNTWELLAESRARALAQVDAINALRDFWLAEADLQLVMLGHVPESFVSLAAGGGDSPAAAGH
ncbi:hypothetical protein [Vogesella indigofera]|uniref:Outer membrane efflux protein n=1 Tax=Vogesella indigofera TaxID=45465 RepID=A0ABT5I816_VOGIN|nr:hypothetical protein [Vogesella indigofera]MDC7692317.1 hypothetical protein [Vogesella indigofera]